LVLIDHNLLLEVEGSSTIVPAPLRVLEACRSWRDGRLQPITFSVEPMTHCILPLVMEEMRMD